MQMKTLGIATAMTLALSMGAAHAIEANTSTQATTTIQAADGTWSDVTQGSADAATNVGARAGTFLQAPTNGALSSSVTGGALSSDVTGGALNSTFNSTARTRSNTTLGAATDLGVNAEVGTRNQRAGVRAGSNTGVGLGGTAGVGIGIGR